MLMQEDNLGPGSGQNVFILSMESLSKRLIKATQKREMIPEKRFFLKLLYGTEIVILM